MTYRYSGQKRDVYRNAWVSWFFLTIVTLSFVRILYPKMQHDTRYHVFAVVKPIENVQDAAPQILAVSSWLRSLPGARVHLFCNHQLTIRIFEEYLANHHQNIEFIERYYEGVHGIPLFSSVVDIVQKSAKDGVIILLNSDIHLSDDVFLSVEHVKKVSHRLQWHGHWFLCSSRFDVEHQNNNKRILHTFGGVDLFAWPAGVEVTIDKSLPPFIWGRPRYDNWFLNQVIQDGLVHVVDITEAAKILHVTHSHTIVNDSKSGENVWTSGNTHSNWQIYINNALAFKFGKYRSDLGTTRHATYKLINCEEAGHYCLTKRLRPAICPCEYSIAVTGTQTDPIVLDDTVLCGRLYLDSGSDYPLDIVHVDKSSRMLPNVAHSLENLASSVHQNGWIVLARVKHQSFQDVMSYVCNLQALFIHPIILTSDPYLWEQLFLRSIGVIYTDVDTRNEFEYKALGLLLKFGYKVLHMNTHSRLMKPIHYLTRVEAKLFEKGYDPSCSLFYPKMRRDAVVQEVQWGKNELLRQVLIQSCPKAIVQTSVNNAESYYDSEVDVCTFSSR